MKNLPLTELFGIKKKVAVVTGAEMGIGAAIAARLAEAGACVVLADVASRVADGIQAKGGIARAFPCDVSRVTEVRAVVYAGEDVDSPRWAAATPAA